MCLEKARNTILFLLNQKNFLNRMLTRDPSTIEFSWLEMSGEKIFELDLSARKSRTRVGRGHDHHGQGDQTDD